MDNMPPMVNMSEDVHIDDEDLNLLRKAWKKELDDVHIDNEDPKLLETAWEKAENDDEVKKIGEVADVVTAEGRPSAPLSGQQESNAA